MKNNNMGQRLNSNLFKMVCTTVLIIAPLLLTIGQNGGNLNLGADMVSRYVWRGTDFGNSPAIQPSMSYTNSGFSIGAWGSYTINSNNFQEADLFINYTIKEVVTLQVFDFFFPNGTSANNKYFYYNEDSTCHQFEGSAKFNGTNKIPITFLLAYNLYGFDKDNSIYFELSYSGKIKSIGFDLFAGVGKGSFYTYDDSDKFAIVNAGVSLSKDIQITDKFILPVFSSLILNPKAESIFIVFGISL